MSVPRREHPVVRHGDRLEGHGAAGGGEARERGEVVRPVVVADRLDHLDADDRVIGPLNVAVVAQVDPDSVGDPLLGEPCAGEVALTGRQRDRMDVRSPARRLDRELAPPGPDLEDPSAGPDAGVVEHAVDLAALGRFEAVEAGGIHRGEPRRRIRHRRVQEGREDLVGQVVVVSDIGRRALAIAEVVARVARFGEAAEAGDGRRDEVGESGGEGCQQVGEIGARCRAPLPRHEPLADPDLGVDSDAVEERPRMDPHRRSLVCGCGPDDLSTGAM